MKSRRFQRVSQYFKLLVGLRTAKKEVLSIPVQVDMSPISSVVAVPLDSEVEANKEWNIKELWHDFADWVVRAAHRINEETLEHPYFIALALFILWAWPHLLMLPVWFSKDAYRRMDDHARSAASRITAPVRRRKRDTFASTYQSIVNASYEPQDTSRPPLFGGTPLSAGDFTIEEERCLPVALRVIRWSALGWAVYILGRELYFVSTRY